jgi:membrane protein DedA with SNARE-associated domain
MNFGVFLVLTTLGTLIWNVVLVNIGAAVGGSWETIVGYMEIYSNVIYVILSLLFISCVVLFVRKRMILNN